VRIGVDGGCWSNGRGYGRFARELLRAMVALAPEDEWVFLLDEQTADGFDLDGARVVAVRQRAMPSRAAAADGYRSPGDLLRFTRAVWREKPAVFFSPSVYTFFPLPPRVPAVVAIHDVIAERYPELTLPTARARLFWRAKVRLARLQAAAVITVSEYSADELVRVLGIPRERIHVVEPAPAAAYRPGSSEAEIAQAVARFGLKANDGWFTYVGGFNPHKRVDRLVRAHAQVVRLMPDAAPHLLLVGSVEGDVFHRNVEEIRAATRESGTEGLVHWAGYVPDDQLRHLHAGARALVLVSEAEGFGLPAVEAAACATPVIATRRSPLPGLLAGGGIFVEPGDEAALVDAMTLLATEPARRDELGRRAARAAARLTWANGAAAALAVLRATAGNRGARPRDAGGRRAPDARQAALN
jgi:alpha-1,3-rhamnosyl/mannosyltransferase